MATIGRQTGYETAFYAVVLRAVRRCPAGAGA